ncbi:MAG: ABC transporter ATP-binding protein [Betaproteobacteria bacterium]|nr:ABC transporter ATP-binding protein [Betaproteobacteria bacterium]
MTPPLLEVRDLHKKFGAVTAASNINVSFAAGETVGIIGANGAGKTTFVNMITGYLPPSYGTILYRGADITRRPPRDIARLGICRSFQVSQVFTSLSVIENLLTAVAIASSPGLAMLRPLRRPELLERAEVILERYRIAQHRDQLASDLSQGARKLLDIAMAVVSAPRVLLLDEPTSGISSEEKTALMDVVMEALKQDQMTILFIEHDMEIVERYVDRVLAFYQGEIICDAPPAEALRDAKVLEYVIGTEVQPEARGHA